jgi:diadenosine tetraphosphate (Ap4A) HIT family hydrolase
MLRHLEGFHMHIDGCAHCAGDAENRLFEGHGWRVVLVRETGFEGWCRVIWDDHVSELTDLSTDDRLTVFSAVVAVETALRLELSPTKINIASLGTGAPHLHFHVIPRFSDDPTFPEPVWLPPQHSNNRVLPEGFEQRMRDHLAKALQENPAQAQQID